MKKSQFAVSKFLTLRQARKGTSLGEIGCKRGIREASDNSRENCAHITWEMLALRLKAENDQLKKIASSLSRENEMLRRQSAVRFTTQIKDVAC